MENEIFGGLTRFLYKVNFWNLYAKLGNVPSVPEFSVPNFPRIFPRILPTNHVSLGVI